MTLNDSRAFKKRAKTALQEIYSNKIHFLCPGNISSVILMDYTLSH